MGISLYTFSGIVYTDFIIINYFAHSCRMRLHAVMNISSFAATVDCILIMLMNVITGV